MAEFPICCTLSGPERATRLVSEIATLRRDQQEVRWLPEGVTLRFRAEPGRLAAPAEFVEYERQCCAFLQFRLTAEPGGGPIWLELTGPAGTRAFLATELGLVEHSE